MNGNGGHFDDREGYTCHDCGCPIGDYVEYENVKRCIGCWLEFDVTVLFEKRLTHAEWCRLNTLENQIESTVISESLRKNYKQEYDRLVKKMRCK